MTFSLDRIADANFNRCIEALRVLEDISRFQLNSEKLSLELKDLRHQIARALDEWIPLSQRVLSRDTENDVGTPLTHDREGEISSLLEIIYRNARRASESLRVLEELSKLKKKNFEQFKKSRYQVYIIEKKLFQQCQD